MSDQLKSMLIGIFVVAACVLTVSLILFLKPKVGDGKQTIYVRFSDVNRINIGTRVLFAGKAVGEVVAINEIYDARQKPSTDLIGRVYYYQLTLNVDSHVKVYDTDKISVQTSGLLGERSISIIPQIPPKGITPQLISNQPIYAESTDPIENAFIELSNLGNHMEVTVKEITRWIQNNGDDLGDTIRSFGCAMDEIHTAVKSVNDEELIPTLKTGVENFSDTMCSIDDAIIEMKDGDVFLNAGDVMQNMKCATHSIAKLTQDMEDGKGTMGKLFKSDDLYLRINAILSKGNTMMNDINHYGILFHLNKSWQRQRQQRVVLLNALDTPKNFKNYFETEVDQINTAMSRISMLIDKAEANPERQKILSDQIFREDFAELLRQADELSDNLRLYNEQLQEAQGN